MLIEELLSRDCTRSAVPCTSKKRAIEIISELGAQRLGMESQDLFERLLARVITSYSIHYTKLYDEGLFAFLDERFDQACQLLFACTGKVIVMGMGKSGHIAGKLAATLASTGTPAFFVHPGEASHGDLGMIGPQDA